MTTFRKGDIVKLGGIVTDIHGNVLTVKVNGYEPLIHVKADSAAVKIPILSAGDSVTWGDNPKNAGAVRGLAGSHAWIERTHSDDDGDRTPKFLTMHIAGVQRRD